MQSEGLSIRLASEVTASTMGSTDTPASSNMLSAVVRGVVGCTVCSCPTFRLSLRSSPCPGQIH